MARTTNPITPFVARNNLAHKDPARHATSDSKPASRAGTGGLGMGKSALGLGSKTLKRHRKVLRDNIRAITKPDIRRIARRGGVKRISGMIYEETRTVLKERLERSIVEEKRYSLAMALVKVLYETAT
ncbi:Histone H4 [Elasticomyces elasticus]|nr:Histone H4 [Elasticomyces elasticus]